MDRKTTNALAQRYSPHGRVEDACRPDRDIVITAWGAMARSDDHAREIVQDLVDTKGATHGTDR
jgi:hypothetical protein